VSQDGFGWAVALSGDTALVSAPGENQARGSVYVLVRSGTSWIQQQNLTASDGAPGDRFGSCVDLSGDTAVVGAPTDNLLNGVGVAYVFVRSGGVWSEQAKLVVDGMAGERFAASAAVLDDRVLIGAHQADLPGGIWNAGSVFVFARSGTTWTQEAKLIPSDASLNDNFGISIALSGDRALIGGPDDSDEGAAYLFARTGTIWIEQQKLTPSALGSNDRFGWDVALSGDTALVGAPQSLGSGTGSATVFVDAGTNWIEQQELIASDAEIGDQFGWASRSMATWLSSGPTWTTRAPARTRGRSTCSRRAGRSGSRRSSSPPATRHPVTNSARPS
jgi:hypothetical protein